MKAEPSQLSSCKPQQFVQFVLFAFVLCCFVLLFVFSFGGDVIHPEWPCQAHLGGWIAGVVLLGCDMPFWERSVLPYFHL